MNPERICYGCFQEKEPGTVCPHCGFNENEEQPYLALPLGTLLNGRYMLGKVLGIGGFGITYLGYDLTLEIKVAIKEYMPSSIATRNADRYNVTLTGRVEEDYQYGMERFDIREVTVNEQNPQAVGFYRHMGFSVFGRTDTDDQGAPYPLLYMERRGPDAAPRFEQDNLYAEE